VQSREERRERMIRGRVPLERQRALSLTRFKRFFGGRNQEIKKERFQDDATQQKTKKLLAYYLPLNQ